MTFLLVSYSVFSVIHAACLTPQLTSLTEYYTSGYIVRQTAAKIRKKHLPRKKSEERLADVRISPYLCKDETTTPYLHNQLCASLIDRAYKHPTGVIPAQRADFQIFTCEKSIPSIYHLYTFYINPRGIGGEWLGRGWGMVGNSGSPVRTFPQRPPTPRAVFVPKKVQFFEFLNLFRYNFVSLQQEKHSAFLWKTLTQ